MIQHFIKNSYLFFIHIPLLIFFCSTSLKAQTTIPVKTDEVQVGELISVNEEIFYIEGEPYNIFLVRGEEYTDEVYIKKSIQVSIISLEHKPWANKIRIFYRYKTIFDEDSENKYTYLAYMVSCQDLKIKIVKKKC